MTRSLARMIAALCLVAALAAAAQD